MQSCSEIKRARNLLGTVVEITAEGLPAAELHEAANAAFDAIAVVQRLMSFHETGSDLHRLNTRAHMEPVPVHSWTYEVLSAALKLSRATGGVFDVTVGELLVEWRYLPDHGAPAGAGERGTFHDIVLEPEQRVRFLRPLTVDLGGIAKGFAVDVACGRLKDLGVRSGVVNAGGDLFAFGPSVRRVAVRMPDEPGAFLPLCGVRDQALATSSPSLSQFQWDGRSVSPLIDGVSETPCVGDVSISVRAPSCLLADGLTKIISRADKDWSGLLMEHGASAFKLEGGGIYTMGAPLELS